jgi:hypothetical protein
MLSCDWLFLHESEGLPIKPYSKKREVTGSHDGESLNSHLVEVTMIMITRINNEIKLSVLKSNIDMIFS